MRIIAGKHKGFVFPGHRLAHTRPTTDRAKESLMSILQHQVDWEKSRVLDLYSGTGNLGFECLSRGAAEVHMVEQHPRNIDYIRRVAQTLQAEVQLHRAKVLPFLEGVHQAFDLVLADPPYGSGEFPHLLDAVLNARVVKPGGLFVVEHASQHSMEHPMCTDVRTYGQSRFSFFTFE